MRVLKRNGSTEEVSFDKVLRRIQYFCKDLEGVDAHSIAGKVCSRIYDQVPTSKLDELTAQLCSTLMTDHPDWGTLAARITVSNHHKNTTPSFSEAMSLLYNAVDVHGQHNPLISEELWNIVQSNKEKLNHVIDYQRDYSFDYFGFKTLERSYLLRVNKRVVERPQHMFMRVALGIHGYDLREAIETYELMSKKYFIHATPTLFNAGTPRPQLSSCFLLDMRDSITGIFKTLSDCAHISKFAGGIGIHIQDIRSKGSHIRGTNGHSSGIIPLLRIYNNTARFVDQAGKRKGSIAVYLEPWHADILSFLDLRKNHGNEEERCRDLFTALWIPDLFMKRVEKNEVWSLMCPDECPGLTDAVGEEFERLYCKYEAEGRYRKQVLAQQVWIEILKSQIETGTPYMCYKDAANLKSNQKNLGVIKSSNLCSEIIEYSDENEVAVCNLASIALGTFVTADPETGSPSFDLKKLHEVTQVITRNLNKVIDKNFYPIPEAACSNRRHRPIGIGVQGLADAYIKMRYPFDSPEAADLNKQIFETIYHGALTASMRIAKKRQELLEELDMADALDICRIKINEHLQLTVEEEALKEYRGAYCTFKGSPAYHGQLQFDLWGEKPYGNWDWEGLKEDIKRYGLRNSLLLCNMPTASTSQILGQNECFEPLTSTMFQRRTLSGEFNVVCKYLIDDLIGLGLWNKTMKNRIMINDGSIQSITEIPQEIRDLYKTVWDIKQKVVLDQAADRSIYICQSSSMNLYLDDSDIGKLSKMHLYGWKRGLKTGCYYLRTKPKAKPQAFTVDHEFVQECEACSA